MPHDSANPTAQGDPDPTDWDKLYRMLDELPPGIPTLLPEDAMNFSKYRHKPQLYEKDQAWAICIDAMEKYDNALCKAYREEIDTLLVFAGLFSAVVTAFTVESYQWLKDDPSDAMISLLAQIAKSVGPNADSPSAPPSSSGLARAASARINSYWFISLALSLSAALVAILGKQWVREYERQAADLTPKEVIGVRQLKLEGLEYWKVGGIISALPLLLQLSLALFALGILELLWHLDVAVAITVCIPTLAALVFYFMTTMLPVVQYSHRFRNSPPPPQCAYKSPQALLAMHTYQFVSSAWGQVAKSFRDSFPFLGIRIADTIGHNILRFDRCVWRMQKNELLWNRGWTHIWHHWDRGLYVSDRHCTPPRAGGSHFRGLHWMSHNMDEKRLNAAVWTCFWDEAHSTDRHPADNAFPHSIDGRASRLRRGILHRDPDLQEQLPDAPLWLSAVCLLPRTKVRPEFMTEILVHNLHSIGVGHARLVLSHFRTKIPVDPGFLSSLVRAVASYAQMHIDEDAVAQIIDLTSDIVSYSPDRRIRSVLVRAVSAVAITWLRAPAFPRYIRNTVPCLTSLKNALRILSLIPEGYVQHPSRLHDLPHIRELADLMKFAYDGYAAMGGAVPRRTPPRFNHVVLMICARDVIGDGYEHSLPIVKELLKISVCGVNPDGNCVEPTHESSDSLASRNMSIESELRHSSLTCSASTTKHWDVLPVDSAERLWRQGFIDTPSTANIASEPPASFPGRWSHRSAGFECAGRASSRDNASIVSTTTAEPALTTHSIWPSDSSLYNLALDANHAAAAIRLGADTGPVHVAGDNGQHPQHVRSDQSVTSRHVAEPHYCPRNGTNDTSGQSAERDPNGDSAGKGSSGAHREDSAGASVESLPGRAEVRRARGTARLASIATPESRPVIPASVATRPAKPSQPSA